MAAFFIFSYTKAIELGILELLAMQDRENKKGYKMYQEAVQEESIEERIAPVRNKTDYTAKGGFVCAGSSRELLWSKCLPIG